MGGFERPVGEARGSPGASGSASQTGSPSSPSSAKAGFVAIAATSWRRRGRPDRVAPGTATWASVRKPPGVVVDGREPGSRRRGCARPASAGRAGGLVRGQRPAEVPGQEAGDGRAVGRVLVQPRVLAAGDDAASRPGRSSRSPVRRGPGARAARASRSRWPTGTTASSRRGPAGSGRGSGRSPSVALMSATTWPRGREVDPRRQPGERIGDRVGDRQVGEAERLAGEPVRIGRARRSRRRPRRAGRRRRRGSPRSRPSSGRRWPRWSPRGRAISASNVASASSPNSPALTGRSSGGFAPWPRTSMVRQWKPAAWRKLGLGQRPVAGRLPAVDERDAGPGRATAGRDEPGRQLDVVRLDGQRLERQAEGGRGRRSAGAGAGSRPGRGRRARSGRRGRAAQRPRPRRARRDGRVPSRGSGPRAGTRPVKRAGRALHSETWPSAIRTTCSVSSAAPTRRPSRPPGGGSPGRTTRT